MYPVIQSFAKDVDFVLSDILNTNTKTLNYDQLLALANQMKDEKVYSMFVTSFITLIEFKCS